MGWEHHTAPPRPYPPTPLQTSSSYLMSPHKPMSNTVKCIMGYRLLIVVVMLAGVLGVKGPFIRGKQVVRPTTGGYARNVGDAVGVGLRVKGARMGMVVDDALRGPEGVEAEVTVTKGPSDNYLLSTQGKDGGVLYLSAAKKTHPTWVRTPTVTEHWSVATLTPPHFLLVNPATSRVLTFSPNSKQPGKRWRLNPTPCPVCTVVFEPITQQSVKALDGVAGRKKVN
eukprot:TRINITY_DN6112_c0_g1_i1.p1 TRINITY_DN6112_c0_g1~~TRINITY_DN6112_c0_g1_i1.p1  ORF type:complete len:226 (+),score=31.76 TRINITY_DN6112_c0_g1_i1:185-862(+)